jgi:hypothetical protein
MKITRYPNIIQFVSFFILLLAERYFNLFKET